MQARPKLWAVRRGWCWVMRMLPYTGQRWMLAWLDAAFENPGQQGLLFWVTYGEVPNSEPDNAWMESV
jgi:hypothetical protein